MRRILPLAFSLLVVALMVRWERSSHETPHGWSSELGLTLLSKGQLVPVIEDAVYQRYGIANGVITHDAVYRFQKPGLHLTVFDKAFQLVDHRNISLNHDPSTLHTLNTYFDEVDPGSILAFNHLGGLNVTDENDRATQLLQKLGARANPFSGLGSWCFLAVKDETTWRPLAESFAKNRNAHLNWSVTPAQLTGQHSAHTFVEMTNEAGGSVSLFDEYAMRHEAVGSVSTLYRHTLDGETLKTLRVFPLFNKQQKRVLDHRMTWKGLNLQAEAQFSAQIALYHSAREVSDGVAFVLYLDDREMARKHCPPEEASFHWQPFEAELPPCKNATLSLVVEILDHGKGDYALWGNPRIHYDGAD